MELLSGGLFHPPVPGVDGGFMLRVLGLVLASLLIAAPSLADTPARSGPAVQKGDDAPPVKVRWMQGDPISRLEKGRIYVIDFWATWCGPCVAAMPRLSELAGKYRDTVTFIGVDVWERSRFPDAEPVERVEQYLQRHPGRMSYRVAVDEEEFMATRWLRAAGQGSIPVAFLIDRDGRIAWIGDPAYLDFDAALEKAVAKPAETAAP